MRVSVLGSSRLRNRLSVFRLTSILLGQLHLSTSTSELRVR